MSCEKLWSYASSTDETSTARDAFGNANADRPRRAFGRLPRVCSAGGGIRLVLGRRDQACGHSRFPIGAGEIIER